MFRAPVPTLAAAVVLAASASAFSVSPAAVSPKSSGSMPPVVANDNRRPAGRLEGDTLKRVAARRPRIVAAGGARRPSAVDRGVRGRRVRADGARAVDPREAGTLIDVTLRNDLDVPLQVHGLCARDGAACPPLAVPPRETRQVQFRIDQPGTYHYWADDDRGAGAVPRAGRRADRRSTRRARPTIGCSSSPSGSA